MLFSFASRLVTLGAGFVYPTYASYKAIRTNEHQAIETWLMYWVVMGVVVAAEHSVEWAVRWIPFYYEAKTAVILWLTLPQIQGSTYIYIAHVHPFLERHEREIDDAVADAKRRAKRAGIEWLNQLLLRVKQFVLGAGNHQAAANAGQQPQDVSSMGRQLFGFANSYLQQYAPGALAAGNALLHPMNGRDASVRDLGHGAAPAQPRRNLGSAATSATSSRAASANLSKQQARARRAELEAQLAMLDAASSSSASSREPSPGTATPPSSAGVPFPSRPPSSSYNPRSVSGGYAVPRLTRTSDLSGSSRLERSTASGLGYEQIDRDEVRGYGNVAGPGPPNNPRGNGRRTASEAVPRMPRVGDGPLPPPPPPQHSSSWPWSWWSGTPEVPSATEQARADMQQATARKIKRT